MGQDNTYYRLKEEAWWLGIQEDIKEYIRSCNTYQKRAKKKQISQVSSATIVTEPFVYIGIDVMGPLLVTRNGK